MTTKLMSKPGSIFIAYFFALFLVFIVVPESCFSQGNLLVTPRRIIFDGSRRVMELNLANTGQDTAKYNVSLVQYRMNENGSFTEIFEPDPGQKFADKNLRFFPRTVTLPPNEAQVVKMQVTNVDKLLPGEYRSHVYFRSVPKQDALGSESEVADSSQVSIKLIPIFGITIPVIIRVGDDDTKVNINDLKFIEVNDTTKRVDFTFTRVGRMSVYGDLKITYVSTNGKETQIGAINGIAVYTPNTIRKQSLILENLNNIKLTEGKIVVKYMSQSDNTSKILAENEIILDN